MNTWSGQPEESAWHWSPENCHKLGNVLLLLKCGTAAKREQAYQEFIELKRWFIEEEFDQYLNSLDDMRVSMGSEPLRQIMEEIRGERAPVTGWKAKAGKAIDPVMLPEMEKKYLVLVHQESGCAWIADKWYYGDGLVEPDLQDATLEACKERLKYFTSIGYNVYEEPEIVDEQPEMEGRKHVPVKHPDTCNCILCSGGLFQCAVCNGAEGQLTTECCGKWLSQEVLDGVFDGHCDFVGGKWVNLNADEPLKASDIIARTTDVEFEAFKHEIGKKALAIVEKLYSNPVTRYDLFITLLKRGYHALEM